MTKSLKAIMAATAAIAVAALPVQAQQNGYGQSWMMQRGWSNGTPMGSGPINGTAGGDLANPAPANNGAVGPGSMGGYMGGYMGNGYGGYMGNGHMGGGYMGPGGGCAVNGYGPGMMMQGQGPGNGMMGGWMMTVPGRGGLARVDANEDGAVTAEEAAFAADQVFAAMDSDDDGALSEEEYMAVRMGTGDDWNAQRQAARQSAGQARFAAVDKDKNGMASKAEFMDAAKAHFDAADADKDGIVSPWEFRRQAWD